MAKDLFREEVTTKEVRKIIGADEDLISDDNIDFMIKNTRKSFENLLNTDFVPTEKIEIQKMGFYEDKIHLRLRHTPVLNIYKIKLGDRDLDNYDVDYNSGVVRFFDIPHRGYYTDPYFWNLRSSNFKINYLCGYIEKDEAEKSFLTEDIEPGDEVTVKVDNVENVNTDEWVWLIGMDGNEEVCQVKSRSKSDNEFVLKRVTQPHEEGTLIYRVRVSEAIKSLILYEVALRIAIYATGGTYTFNTTYSLGEMSVSKGVPYTHWAKVFEQSKSLKEEILREVVRPRFYVA